MEYIFEVEYEKNYIKEYEKHVLMDERCDAFLPTTFIMSFEKDIATYNYSGYQPLCCIELTRVEEVLSCLEKVLLNMMRGEEYLINPCKINLSCSTVYYNTIDRKLKIAYVPAKTPRENVGLSVILLIEELEKQYSSRQLVIYFEKLKAYVSANHSILDIINKIAEFKRDAYLCGIA